MEIVSTVPKTTELDSKILNTNEPNPCLTCGACCAHYRASFYWGETDEHENGTVPAYLTDRLDPFRSVMKGTNQQSPRCIALNGQIGECVNCSIYENRSSVCREFLFAWENGLPNERCDKARLAWGLQPLEPPVLQPDAGLPKAA